MKIIQTDLAPAPVGPYSQAIESEPFVFCSGQVALDAKTGLLVGKTAAEQTNKIMDNIHSVLAAADLKVNHIVKTTIFLTDMNTFSEVNAVYEKRLEGHKPARSTVEVSALPKGAIVEIECIAARSRA